jgi:hypothetical protein
MSKAALICAVMGPEKAREELLSYLVGKKEEMDQVLLALSKSLAFFVPYIGGADHCHRLIPLFEQLLNSEETVVRTAGKICCFASIYVTDDYKISMYCSHSQLQRQYAPFFRRS